MSIFFVGCLSHSTNSITNLSQATPDDRLNGIWNHQDESTYLHFGRLKNGTIKILNVEHKKNGDLDYIISSSHRSVIGKNTYLNMQVENIDKMKDEYFFVKYAFDDPNTLKISFIDFDGLESLIRSEKIKGEINKKKVIPNIRITDTSENIEKLLRKHDSLLFKKFISFKKIAPNK